MVSPWVSALSCHSSLFGTCIPAALVCIPCMLVPVPLATTGRTLHALEPRLGGAGVWLYGVLHVLLCQVLVLPACLCSRSFFAVVGHGALVLAFSALLLIYASSFSWAVPLRGPKRERYTVVLAPPPCKIPTTTTARSCPPHLGGWDCPLSAQPSWGRALYSSSSNSSADSRPLGMPRAGAVDNGSWWCHRAAVAGQEREDGWWAVE